MLSLQQFADCIGSTMMNATLWHSHFVKAMAEFNILDGMETASFLAQTGHESESFKKFEENLNYSAKRLTEVWKRRFPTIASATPYANNSEKLANLVYGSRFGNGAEASGDGWMYRGRGPIQITFADNYRACGKSLNLALIEQPDLLLGISAGARSAAWYWSSHGCKSTCAELVTTTRKINGGEAGLDDRQKRFRHAKAILGV